MIVRRSARKAFRLLISCAVALLCAAAGSAPAAAQSAGQTEVDLELVLLADATGSIDNSEILFQREGYARAITDPSVISAIRNTLHGRIAVT